MKNLGYKREQKSSVTETDKPISEKDEFGEQR
jgi:hypothetical protein